MRIVGAVVVASGLVLAAVGSAWAADCGGLKSLKLEATEIVAADSVTSGTLNIPEEAPLQGLPPFCRVRGIMRPTSDSKIRFEVWLPEKEWNGRLLGAGNGGFAGSIIYSQIARYLGRGFAVSGTDTGHEAAGTDASPRPRRMNLHQCNKPVYFRLLRNELGKDAA